jgi:hypothetical protein
MRGPCLDQTDLGKLVGQEQGFGIHESDPGPTDIFEARIKTETDPAHCAAVMAVLDSSSPRVQS